MSNLELKDLRQRIEQLERSVEAMHEPLTTAFVRSESLWKYLAPFLKLLTPYPAASKKRTKERK